MRCEGLTKSYAGQLILDRVSLSIDPGQIAVLKGYSGCGKTTLLRCLAGLEAPDKGAIYYDVKGQQIDATRRRAGELFPHVTMVFQQLFLWPHLSCRQNILLVARNSESTAELMSRFGLEGLLDRKPNQLSIGQRQRVAIVRALSFSAPVILLDEVTSALDSQNREIVASILLDAAKGGSRILSVTHDEDFARRLSAEEYRMEHGQIQQVRAGR